MSGSFVHWFTIHALFAKKNKIESTKGGKLLFPETGIIIFQIIL